MPTPELPAAVLAALEEGGVAYAARRFREAREHDQRALVLALEAGSLPGQARALRLLGVCAYRLGELLRSEELLRQAREQARECDWLDEELLVCNHLGATLRRLGKLDEADEVFRWALAEATPRGHMVARARLLGSYGAFMDDLGDDQAAAEHYGRHQELTGLLDDPARLASAHGLVSRASRRRGDLATAQARARQEIELGREVGNPIHVGRGLMHLGQALAEQSLRAGAAGHGELADSLYTEADEALAEAEVVLTNDEAVRTAVEVAVARGSFYLQFGRLHDAHEHARRAEEALNDLAGNEHAHRARVAQLSAEVAAAAGLHGEALWHLGDALEHHLARFEPIRDARLRDLTRFRRQHLVELATRLVLEAGEVEREPEETMRVRALLARLDRGETPEQPRRDEPVDAWRARVREQAQVRWCRLLPGSYDSLAAPSQADLLLADVVYQGPVGDLPRSLFLLFATIERELRSRVFDRLRERCEGSAMQDQPDLARVLRADPPAGLGSMVSFLVRPPESRGSCPGQILDELPGLPQAARALEALYRPGTRVDGGDVPNPLEHRNAIAHGRPLSLGRLEADAVRRVLTLGQDAVLVRVLGLP